MVTFQLQNRLELAVSILHNICAKDVIDGVATSTVDATSLVDTKSLYKGGTDHYKGREVVIYDATGSIADGSTSWVASSASTDCTCSPAFSATITTGDKFLLIPEGITLAEVFDAINQAIQNISGRCRKDKITANTYTECDRHEYACLSEFTDLSKVEYVYAIGAGEELADGVWTGATGVTATQETEQDRGKSCTKLVVSDGVSGGAQLGYFATGTEDLSNYDTIELWVRSDIAQVAANLEFVLCSDTLGATAVDTISFPALTIDTWTRVQLTMSNQELDTAIASIALKQKAATDIGACKIWLEYAYALKAASRQFATISPERWSVVKSTTPYLKLDPVISDNTLLRLSGYQRISLLSDNTTDADIDPAYIVAAASGNLLNNHAVADDTDLNIQKAQPYLVQAERLKQRLSTNFAANRVEC